MRDHWKTIEPGDEKIFHITDSDDEVIEIIKSTHVKKL
jgi:hypothetical protein